MDLGALEPNGQGLGHRSEDANANTVEIGVGPRARPSEEVGHPRAHGKGRPAPRMESRSAKEMGKIVRIF